MRDTLRAEVLNANVELSRRGLAKHTFGNASAVGRRFRTINNTGTQPGSWRTIVGVVSTVRMLGPFNNPGVDDTGFYVPFYATTNGPAISRSALTRRRRRSGASRPCRK